MEELALQQPELIGREEELDKLKQSLENAIAGKGSTIFIAGEAGIGKTRLVSELIKEAEEKDIQLIQGWCLAESLEPLMPIKTALREVGLFHLISGDPPPQIVSSYLIDDSGILIAKSEREELDLDPHIFASMLTAVGNFVKDSMQMIDQVERTGGLNILGYKEFKILIEEYEGLHLATVTKGSLSEFLVGDMREVLSEVQRRYGNVLSDWDGDLDNVVGVGHIISKLVTSGKYDGRFLVDDPKIKQENLLDNVLLGIQRGTTEKPILLFLDDLQWADPSTLNMLHYLARNTRQHRMLIIGTFRPEDIVESWEGKTHQLETVMQNMNREDLLEKLELKRLGAEDTEKIIGSALVKVSFENSFFDKIYKETEGTPFFILEVVKLLVEDKAIAQDEEGVWKLVMDIDKLDIPSKVYDVVKRRLDRLMKEQRDILECAAVIGEEFSPDVLEKTTEMRKITLLKNLNDIEKAHHLIHYLKVKYRFDHSKVREVLYNGISEILRKEYHRIVGDTIIELHKDNLDEVVGELAYHYYEAGDERAGEYLVKAGEKAKEEYANEEAVGLYKSALEMIKEEEEKIVIWEKLAGVQTLIGEYDKAIENFYKARETAEVNETKARMLRKVGDVHEKKGEYDKSLEVLAEAKALIKDEKLLEYGRIYRSESNVYDRKGDFDKGLALSHTALKIFEKTDGEQKDIGNALRAIGNIHMSKGEYDTALPYYKKSLRVMESIGEQHGIAAALGNIGIVYHYERGKVDRALEYHERSLETFEKIGDKRGVATSLNNIGIVYHYERGELIRALEYHERSLEMFEKIGDKRGVATLLSNIGNVYWNKGELGKALEFHEQSLEIEEKIGDKRGIAYSLNNIGSLYLNKGELEKALEYQERSFEICLEIGEKSLSVHNYCGLAEAHLGLGDVPKALENAEKAVEISTDIGAKYEEGMSRRVLGMVWRENKDWGKAAEEFEKAKEILEEVRRKNVLAWLFYEYGLTWKAKGELTKAKEHLEKALSMFEEMGMKLWADKTQKALEELNQ